MVDTTAWSIEAHLKDISNNTLTKREQIAATCLQGMLADGEYGVDCEGHARIAVEYADALIKKLEQTNDGD